MTYLIIFLALIVLRYAIGKNTIVAQQAYKPILFFLFIFAAFRFEVGCDWGTYRMLHMLTQQPMEDLWVRFLTEPFFILLSKLTHSLNLEHYWVNAISVAIFFCGAHAMAKRSADPLMFIILLFPILIINMPMSAVKQGAAIGFMCYAFIAFIDQKLLKFLIFVALASAFHLSALIFFILAPFVIGVMTFKKIIFGGILALPIIGIIALSSYIDLAVNRYIQSDSVDAAGAIFRLGSLLFFSTAFLLFFRNEWKKLYPSQFSLLIFGSIIAFSLLLVFPLSSVLADRFGYYLIPIFTLFLVSIPSVKNLQMRPFWVLYLVLIPMFIVWISLSSHFSHCYQPYKNWLISVPDKEKYYGDINDFEEAQLEPN